LARYRTILIAGLNIAMHAPHPTSRYVDLFRAIFRRQRIVRLGKLHAAMIGSLHPIDVDNPIKGYTGEIYRFLRLDPAEPWFNVQTNKAATDQEVGEVKIPRHLLPHLQRIPFVFRPRVHKLYFVAKDRSDGLGPSAAVKLFERLIQPLVDQGKFPEIVVTAIPDKDTLERIFKLPILESLVIDLVRPNADDGDAAEQRWLRKLEDQKTRRIELKLIAERNGTIEPDGETKAMAMVAAANGKVVATGRDAEGLKVFESTSEKPWMQSTRIDTDHETVINILERL